MNSDSTLQLTHNASITKTSQLTLLGEIIAVYCDSHKKHVHTLCGQNAEHNKMQNL
jgi:hypothetical protein